MRKGVLGIDPNSRKLPNGVGEELLSWAARYGHCRLAERLLDARVIDCKNHLVARALCWAIRMGNANITTLLLSLGIELDKEIFGDDVFQSEVQDSLEMTSNSTQALRGTSGRGHYFEVIKLLLEAGANVNVKGSFGLTLLQRVRSSARMVELLLAAGADCNSHDVNGETPLHGAVLDGNPDVVVQLLVAGANVNTRTDVSIGGETAVHSAAKLGGVLIVGFLLAAPGIDWTVTNIKGWTHLQILADFQERYPEALRDARIKLQKKLENLNVPGPGPLADSLLA